MRGAGKEGHTAEGSEPHPSSSRGHGCRSEPLTALCADGAWQPLLSHPGNGWEGSGVLSSMAPSARPHLLLPGRRRRPGALWLQLSYLVRVKARATCDPLGGSTCALSTVHCPPYCWTRPCVKWVGGGQPTHHETCPLADTMKATGVPLVQLFAAHLATGSAHHARPPGPSRGHRAPCLLTPACRPRACAPGAMPLTAH